MSRISINSQGLSRMNDMDDYDETIERVTNNLLRYNGDKWAPSEVDNGVDEIYSGRIDTGGYTFESEGTYIISLHGFTTTNPISLEVYSPLHIWANSMYANGTPLSVDLGANAISITVQSSLASNPLYGSDRLLIVYIQNGRAIVWQEKYHDWTGNGFTRVYDTFIYDQDDFAFQKYGSYTGIVNMTVYKL